MVICDHVFSVVLVGGWECRDCRDCREYGQCSFSLKFIVHFPVLIFILLFFVGNLFSNILLAVFLVLFYATDMFLQTIVWSNFVNNMFGVEWANG